MTVKQLQTLSVAMMFIMLSAMNALAESPKTPDRESTRVSRSWRHSSYDPAQDAPLGSAGLFIEFIETDISSLPVGADKIPLNFYQI